MSHAHRCARPTCGDLVACTGVFEKNYDGYPNPVCQVVAWGLQPLCDDCEAQRKADEQADAMATLHEDEIRDGGRE